MRISTLFLQAVTVLIGIGAAAFLLWEPNIEGRNAQATLLQVYFNDWFLAYAYAASAPFFVSLYQAFKMLGRVRNGAAFSQANVKALRTITFCAMATIGFVVLGEILLALFTVSDDRAGGVFMGLLIILGASVAGAAATMFRRILQQGVDMTAGTPYAAPKTGGSSCTS